ncbi:acyltransferase family protein [Brachybacterium sp. Z12]|nr:acyltransferase family protein [Brachybacterium sp. Z12]
MADDTSARPRARDPFLDNARGILITLVVVGHTLESFSVIEGVLGGTLYKAIYSFHMAAFVIISGYLSRSYRNEPRQVKRLLTAMLVPYVIFRWCTKQARRCCSVRISSCSCSCRPGPCGSCWRCCCGDCSPRCCASCAIRCSSRWPSRWSPRWILTWIRR